MYTQKSNTVFSNILTLSLIRPKILSLLSDSVSHGDTLIIPVSKSSLGKRFRRSLTTFKTTGSELEKAT